MPAISAEWLDLMFATYNVAWTLQMRSAMAQNAVLFEEPKGHHLACFRGAGNYCSGIGCTVLVGRQSSADRSAPSFQSILRWPGIRGPHVKQQDRPEAMVAELALEENLLVGDSWKASYESIIASVHIRA